MSHSGQVRGWADGPVSKMLAFKHSDLSSIPGNTHLESQYQRSEGSRIPGARAGRSSLGEPQAKDVCGWKA